MKTLYCIISSLILSVPLFGQAPPVLRQSLTTNTASKPTLNGHIPVWNGTSWIPGFPSTASATNITLPVILLPGSATNDAPNGKVAVAGGGINFSTNNVTNFVVSVSDGLTNFITNAIVSLSGDNLWTNDNSVYRPTFRPTNYFIDFTSAPPDVGSIVHSTGTTADWFGKGEMWSGTNYTYLKLTGETNAFTKVVWLQAGDGGQYLIMTDEGTERVVLSPDRASLPYLFDTEGAYTDTTPLFAVRNNGGERFRVLAAGDSYFAHTLTTAGITNTGPHQHNVGAFTGALFVSSNANGVAYWSTNVNNIGVTNLSVYNNVIFNGQVVSNFNRDLIWTNDGAVTKPTTFGRSPQNSLVFGGTVGTGVEALTNFAPQTIAFGSNVAVRGRSASVLGGFANSIETNSIGAAIVGGATNSIGSNSMFSVISGGTDNGIATDSLFSVIAGGWENDIDGLTGCDWSVIGGGQQNIITNCDTATIAGGAVCIIGSGANFSFIGGGQNCRISDGANTHGTIAGGQGCIINGSTCPHGFIGGGIGNQIGSTSATATHNTIGGGISNRIAFGVGGSSDYGFVGGGFINTIGATDSHYNMIGGGQLNRTDSSQWATIGGGYDNILGNSAAGGAIIGGHWNEIASGTNGLIGGGFSNTVSGADIAIITGGRLNRIQSSGDYGYILGHSNNVNAFSAGAIGNRATNALAFSIDIAPNGDTTKATFTASNLTVRTSFATAPDTVVTLAADNQVVDATLRTHIRLASDSAVAGDRTFILTGTNVVSGAHAILEWTGTNAGELVDDAANSGAGNIRLSATWTPTQYDTLSLIFNGTDWVETARATN